MRGVTGLPGLPLFLKLPEGLVQPRFAKLRELSTHKEPVRGDRTFKLGSGITSEYGRYVKYPGEPRDGHIR